MLVILKDSTTQHQAPTQLSIACKKLDQVRALEIHEVSDARIEGMVEELNCQAGSKYLQCGV